MASIFGDFLKGAFEGGSTYLANEQAAKLEQDKIRAAQMLNMEAQDELERRRMEREKKVADENMAKIAEMTSMRSNMAVTGLGTISKPQGSADIGAPMSTGQVTPDSTQPLSARNNNPGNIRGADGEFRKFATPEEGMQAMRDDLMIKIGGKSKAMAANFGENYSPTLSNLISTWAPATENDTNSYIDTVSKKTGIAPDAVLTAQDIEKVQAAMTQVEGGQTAADYFAGSQPAMVVAPDTQPPQASTDSGIPMDVQLEAMGKVDLSKPGAQLKYRAAVAELMREKAIQDERLDLSQQNIELRKQQIALTQETAGTRDTPEAAKQRAYDAGVPWYPIVEPDLNGTRQYQEKRAQEASDIINGKDFQGEKIALEKSLPKFARAEELVTKIQQDGGMQNIKATILGDGGINLGGLPEEYSELNSVLGEFAINAAPQGQGAVSNYERDLYKNIVASIQKTDTVNLNLIRAVITTGKDRRDRMRLMEKAATTMRSPSAISAIIQDWDKVQDEGNTPTVTVGKEVKYNPLYVPAEQYFAAKARAQQAGEPMSIAKEFGPELRATYLSLPAEDRMALKDTAQKQGIVGTESAEREKALESIKKYPNAEARIRQDFTKIFNKDL